jgi:ABC-type branched-subunit amino acid transport system ATPase component
MPPGISVVDVVASGQYFVNPCGTLTSMLGLPRAWSRRRSDRASALECLEIVGLSSESTREASELALGTRRLVELARALCGMPRVLLLDEPASGLSEIEIERLIRATRSAAAAGVAVVLIEHNFEFVSAMADTAYVLSDGQVIATGLPSVLASNPQVIEIYLGTFNNDVPEGPAVQARTGDQT